MDQTIGRHPNEKKCNTMADGSVRQALVLETFRDSTQRFY